MRPFASIIWIALLLLSTSISGVWPPQSPLALGHLASEVAASPLVAPFPGPAGGPVGGPVGGPASAPANQGSPYAPYGPGYGPMPACQINPSQLPVGWPTTARAPFTSSFDQFIANTLHVPPNSAPVPITISQVPTTNISPRTLTGLPYQLLYNNQHPGPTIRVVSQQTDDSTLTIGPDVSTAPPPLTQVSVTNGVIGQPGSTIPFPFFTTHLHGGHTAPAHDGHPDDLNPPMPMMSGGLGTTPISTPPPPHIYSYTNDQQPQILWYHDHADMNPSPHVAAGLFAFYIIEEAPTDPSYPYLPKEPFDIPLGLQVQQAGTLPLPSNANPTTQTLPNYFVSVNGLDSPKLDVEARFYRFRLLNASAGQSVSLELCGGANQPLNDRVWVIGTDGGMLAKPVNLTQHNIGLFQDGRLDILQAERYNILIDFTGLEGQQLYFSSIVRGPNGSMASYTTVSPPTAQNPAVCLDTETTMMLFNVGPSYSPDPTDLSQIGNRSWASDTAFLQANTVDLWELVNTVACGAHPVHVHDIEFQNVTIIGQALSAEQVAMFGWKGIFVLPPPFTPPAATPTPSSGAAPPPMRGHGGG